MSAAFDRAVAAVARRQSRTVDGGLIALRRALRVARRELSGTLAALPAGVWGGPAASVVAVAVRALDALEPELRRALREGQAAAWGHGIDMFVAPYAAVGIAVSRRAGDAGLAPLRDFGASLIRTDVDAARVRIERAIRAGMLSGETPTAIIGRVGEALVGAPTRAGGLYAAVATDTVTELGRAFSDASIAQLALSAVDVDAVIAAREGRDTGGVLAEKKTNRAQPDPPRPARTRRTGKQWIAVIDRVTRDTHRALNRTTIPWDALFSVGGTRAAGPHDRRLPAREVVHCRCHLAPADPTDG